MIQIAALCYRGEGAGREVLLITSRDTGRWVIPKGGLMRGRDAAEAAAEEAWEEAGVRPVAIPAEAIGEFRYLKTKRSGLPIPVRVLVYPMEVAGLEERFPEAGQRRLAWHAPRDAATMVAEPGLREIFERFHTASSDVALL